MLKNYFTIAWRNLLKNRAFSLINILGLTMGMAAFIIIMIYVNFEQSYDQFHEHAADIYRVPLSVEKDGVIQGKVPKNFSGAGPDLKAEFPEVLEYTRIRGVDGTVAFQYHKDNSDPVVFNENKIYFAEPSIFNIFDIELLEGDTSTALSAPNTLLLSASAAQRYFGEEDAIGKVIVARELGFQIPLMVTGVFNDLPANSHFKPELLWSYSSQYPFLPFAEHDWGTAGWWYTYVLLAPGTDPRQLAAKFPDFLAARTEDEAQTFKIALQPLTDIHLHSDMVQELEVNGNSDAIYFLWIIAFAVIIIAWVNYINLATVRSAERAKEVGVRKTSGATQMQLMKQFIFESFLINGISILLAISIAVFTLPYFSQLSGSPLSVNFDTKEVLLLSGIFLLGILLSSFYPAFMLSSLKPSTVMKGGFSKTTVSGNIFRKSLVTFQFAASIILIAGSFIVHHQLAYMQNHDLGMNIDQVLVLNTPDVVTDTTFNQRFDFFRNQLEKQVAISYVASTTSIPGKVDNFINGGLRKKGEEEERGVNYYHMLVDHHFIPALNFNFLAGENFNIESQASQQGLILNQAAVEKLGFPHAESAIGEMLNSFSWRGERPVIGVVENFHQESLKNQDYPIVMLYSDFAGNAGNFYCVKIQGEQVNLSETIDLIKTTWDEAFPNNPFDYFFLDTYYNNLYKAEFRFRKVFSLFTVLAILIACMGLLALSSYTTLQRTKEIGIRKVLGASVVSILVLLSRDYIQLILLAFAVAIPVANYFMIEWLKAFAYKIEIQWWLFALPGVMVLIIALFSVSSQTWKAARKNPVDSLRYE